MASHVHRDAACTGTRTSHNANLAAAAALMSTTWVTWSVVPISPALEVQKGAPRGGAPVRSTREEHLCLEEAEERGSRLHTQ